MKINNSLKNLYKITYNKIINNRIQIFSNLNKKMIALIFLRIIFMNKNKKIKTIFFFKTRNKH